jgi:hypothetical protein
MKTKCLTIVATIFLLLTSFSQQSVANPLGLGVQFGDPTALSGKYWATGNQAYDFGIAFALSSYVLGYGDYLYHYHGFFHGNKFANELSPYLGVGGIFAFTTKHRSNKHGYLGERSGSLGAGIRIPFGIEWKPGRANLGVSIEIVPGIAVIPETSGFFQGGIGIRYYFQ